VTIRLRELTDDELPRFLEEAHAFYTHDLQAHSGLTAERAEAKSRGDHKLLFPGGKRQPGHVVCRLEDADTGEAVGRMWFAQREDGVVFLYQVELTPERRGQGLGREAMRLLEERARELGATSLELNVFGGNAVARGLYRSLGFDEQAVYMAKPL
jgi:ribosomal protein S18 acetylase RimI-like enzyme